MKKILFVFSTLALLTGISTSCQKEEASQQENGNLNTGFTITATIADNGTKVSYSETDGHALKPSWVADEDYIIGFDENGVTYGFQATAVSAGGSATFTRVTDGDYKGTATNDPADDTKMYMFYAPGKTPNDISSQTLTYSLASQSKDVVPALMTASGTVTSGSLSLSFENKCAIIGIKNPKMAAASGTKYTSITLSGKKINTEVVFSLSGETIQATYQTPGMITKAVDFASAGSGTSTSDVTCYIAACPAGSSESTTTLYLTTNNFEGKTKSGVYMAAGNYYYMSPKFENTGMLPGLFTVAEGKQVRFTKGNLYWNGSGSGSAWALESAQNETYATLDQTTYNASHVCHFYWTKTAAASYANSYNDGECATDDVPFFAESKGGLTVDGQSGLYALTGGDNGEWKYLLSSRTNASGLYKKGVSVTTSAGTVANCVVIAPDGYTGNIASSYDADAWVVAESAGLVCLPAAGFREGSSLSYGGKQGYYCSATPWSDNKSWAYSIFFDSSTFSLLYRDSRNYGFSVRLVSTVSE